MVAPVADYAVPVEATAPLQDGPERARVRPSANASAVDPSSSPWSGLNSVTVSAVSVLLSSKVPSVRMAVSKGGPSLRPVFSERGGR